MKKNRLKKLISIAFAGVFIFNGLNVLSVSAIESDLAKGAEKQTINLNPRPKEMDIKGQSFELTSSVNIIGDEVADSEAVKALKSFLTDNNISVNNVHDDNSTTLIIGEVDDNIPEADTIKSELDLNKGDALGEQGYVLATEDSTSKGEVILIEGHDNVGTFYGVQTLTQLLEGTTLVPEVSIFDEPSMSQRGIVEGFYGNPWTQQDRLNQIEFYGQNKLNTYIYAPKDDPYHREKWREAYPESEMQRMKELIDASYENKVDFVFGISPGIDIRFDGQEGEDDFNALVAKAESLYQMGVRSFAIYFDDIENKEGVKQATVLNRFNEEFIKAKGDVKPLITVPTEYDTSAMGSAQSPSKYTSDFATTLHRDIKVMWTGPVVVSENITAENAQIVNDIYGERMAIWWNYPVSDYMKQKLALGPIYGVDTTLSSTVDIFTMNPMEHAEMSKVTLHTGAEYGWNTENYDYNEAFNRSIDMLYGNLADDFRIFADHSTRMDGGWAHTGRVDAPKMREDINSLWSSILNEENVDERINNLYSDFEKMKTAGEKLKVSLPEEQLEECNLQLNKFIEIAKADKMALDMIVAKLDGNTDKYNELKEILEVKHSELLRGAKISEKVGVSFVKEAIDFEDTMVNPKLIKVTGSSEETDKENAELFKASDLDLGTFWHSRWSSEAPKPNYLVLELDKVYEVNKLRYVPRQDGGSNPVTEVKISTSLDGETYTEAITKALPTTSSAKYIDFDPVNAKYVKFEVTGTNNSHASAAEVNVYKTKNEVELEAPVKVTGLKVKEKTNTSVKLDWNDVTNTPIKEYIVYKDGKEFTRVDNSEVLIENLKANNIYNFKVVAEGLDGQKSRPVSISVRTKR